MTGVATEQRFPFINLEKALGRAESLYKADHRGADMSVPTAFAVWSYSEKSSGGFQTVAALKMYGLLVDSAADGGRRMKLSEKALRYFRDERDEERAKQLREFALEPPLLRSLWNQWGSELPSDTVARSKLKIDRSLSEQSARTLLGLYKENLVYTGLKGHGKLPKEGGELDLPLPADGEEAPAKAGDYVQWTSNGVNQFRIPRRVVWVSDDGDFVQVHGSPTGIPMDEVKVVEPPAPPKPSAGATAPADKPPQDTDGNDINVYLTGARLQITADVDDKGLKKLKKVLEKYEEILKLMTESVEGAFATDYTDDEEGREAEKRDRERQV